MAGVCEVIFLFMALDSFLLSTLIVESWLHSVVFPSRASVVVRDADRFHDPFRLRPGQIDREQPMLEVSPENPHSVREHEGALELTRRDAAVEILPGLFLLLPAADEELVFLDRDIELITGEPGDRQRDAQAFRPAVLTGDPLDIVRRVSVRGLCDTIARTPVLVEPGQERTGQRRHSRHVQSPHEATLTSWALAAPARSIPSRAPSQKRA